MVYWSAGLTGLLVSASADGLSGLTGLRRGGWSSWSAGLRRGGWSDWSLPRRMVCRAVPDRYASGLRLRSAREISASPQLAVLRSCGHAVWRSNSGINEIIRTDSEILLTCGLRLRSVRRVSTPLSPVVNKILQYKMQKPIE